MQSFRLRRMISYEDFDFKFWVGYGNVKNVLGSYFQHLLNMTPIY